MKFTRIWRNGVSVRWYIDGKRVSKARYELAETMCRMQGKNYNNSYTEACSNKGLRFVHFYN